MAQTLSTIKALLREYGLSPRHRFGQNFLHDPNKLRNIIEAAKIGEGDLVLEVGPGTGVLTEAMLEAGARVVAAEIDHDLCVLLRDRLSGEAGFTLVEGDALASKHELAPGIEEALGGREVPFKLIANLPYNIASPLIATLAIDWPGMELAIVMVQKEVADRLTAGPGGKDYGPLGVIVQAMCEADVVTTLSPNCFWPAPKVASAVTRLRRRAQPLTVDPQGLSAFLHTLFSKRRKQIGGILRGFDDWPEGVCAKMRAEQLTVEQLIELEERVKSAKR
ncbi:MAG: 16S rRNA (adenine(1518)-N(6)/adenine(1519)-N(6))-dimethyltransferase RsmA [Planctomycetota bacterium]